MKNLILGAKVFASISLITLISSCSNFSFGPNVGTSNISTLPQTQAPISTQTLPNAKGEIIGSGNVRVALLLPLSGNANLSRVGVSMANGAKLAMDFIEKNSQISNNITIVIKDTAGDSSIAASKASEAIAEGASLILGPLRGQNVQAVGEIAKMANIPVIGFSNNSNAASAGVYLLNVLPQSEVRRSLKYAASLGHSSFVSIAPTSNFGQIQQNAFIQETTKLGLNASGTYSFNNEGEARNAIQTIIPLIQEGQVSAIFIPDRATAPSFGVLLEAAGIDRSKILLIGSADWENDLNISQTPYLSGAIFPAIDDRGQQAIKPDYLARFGSKPHPFTTIAYTATLLANSKSLSKSNPAFSRASLTNAAGFNGRDGLFRFLVDGKSEYALIMKSVTNGGSVRVDGPKLP